MRRALTTLCHLQVPMALSGLLFVYSGAVLLGRDLAWPWYPVAFFGCLYIYLLDAASKVSPEDEINSPSRASFYERHETLRTLLPRVVILIAAIFVWILGVTSIADQTYLLLGAMAALGGLYIVPLMPSGDGKKRLKDFAVLKPFLVSLPWLLGAIALPLLEGEETREVATHPALIGVFLYAMLVLDSIALDWRDRVGDAQAGLRTIAVRLGARTGPALVLGAIVCAVVWVAGLRLGTDPRWLWGAGMMWFVFGNVAVVLPRLQRWEVGHGLAVMAWRFTGGLTLLALAQ